MDQQRHTDRVESDERPLETAEQTGQGDGAFSQAGNRTAESGKKANASKAGKEALEWLKALVIAGILVFVIRWFLFAPFIVEGPSMLPNFESGERLIVNKIIYDIREPKRGEVIVFHVPEEGRDFIKRVIGVPGDRIRLEGDDLYINGEKVEEPYLREAIAEAKARGTLYNEGGPNFPNDWVKEDTVPEDSIFVMGDNRSNSQDSRMIGFVSEKEIVGRADLIFWPLNKLAFVNH